MVSYYNEESKMDPNSRLEELCQLVSSAQEEVQAHKDIATELDQAKLRAQALRTQVGNLEKAVTKQRNACKKLENSTSLEDFLFYSLCNCSGQTKADRMEKLRKDEAANQEKLAMLQKGMKSLDENISSWACQAALLPSLQTRYDELFAEKKALILCSSDSKVKIALKASSNKQAQLEQDIALLDRAVTAGKSLLASLRTVQSHLQSAANWGTADMMGGGMMVTMAKRNAIDQAKNASKKTKKDMEQFSHILGQLGQNVQHDLESMGGFSAFADYFMDGIFIDWHVQSQIRKASDSCRKAISKTSSILQETESKLAIRRSEVEQCNQEQIELVLSAGPGESGVVDLPDKGDLVSPQLFPLKANREVIC